MLIPNSGYSFEYFVEATRAVHSKERLFELFVETMRGFGFDRLNFSVKRDPWLPPEAQGFGIISTYPADWQQYYIERDFARIDPVLRRATSLVNPFTWRQIERQRGLTPQQRRFLKEGEAAGLYNGKGIPFNGGSTQIAGIALATSSRSADHFADLDLLSAFANHFYCRFKSIMGLTMPTQPSTSPLSPRETEILQWITFGKSDDQISAILAISDNTVAYHLKQIFLKLNAATRVQAVVVALASGLIEL